jgi:chromate reductase, NAD(P)H dehydrogenase (quinone)
MKIAIIIGSLREHSYNKRLAEYFTGILPNEVEYEFISVDVPLMNEDLEHDIPEMVKLQAEKARSADAVLIVSPEYNRGVPGVLKNLLDWLSRGSLGEPLKGKPGAIAGVSTGAIGTAVMQSHLRGSLAHMGVVVLAMPAVTMTVGTNRLSPSGEVLDSSKEFLQNYINEFIAHIEKNIQ